MNIYGLKYRNPYKKFMSSLSNSIIKSEEIIKRSTNNQKFETKETLIDNFNIEKIFNSYKKLVVYRRKNRNEKI